MVSEWCPVCCTQHRFKRECPGELSATGPERHGWRVNVLTPRGMEAIGVLVAECEDLWRARVLTYPNVLWRAPGLEGAVKFVGATAREAERQAVAFIRQHCREQHWEMRDELAPVESASLPRDGRSRAAKESPARRKIRFLPILYGVIEPSDLAGTGNLSESGLFIITGAPVEAGKPLAMSLEVDTGKLNLRGRVVWMRRDHRVGRAPGMGVQLWSPPAEYVAFVRALP